MQLNSPSGILITRRAGKLLVQALVKPEDMRDRRGHKYVTSVT
jgi:hypothetical protein